MRNRQFNGDNVMQAMAASLAPAIAKELGVQYKAPTGVPSTPYMHGPGGLFGVPGLERDIISTRVAPTGIAGTLPVRTSTFMSPEFAYITGFLAPSGTDPDGPCDDGRTAGPIKNCIQTAHFGRYTFQTRELERNRLGQLTNRGEFNDLQLVNDPLLSAISNLMPNTPALDLANDVLERMYEVGVAFQDLLVRQFYTGDPSNATNGGYDEFPGADILVGTNKVDALTGSTCPTLYSDIKDFNYGLVSDTANSDIVRYLTYMLRYVRSNARRGGFSNPEWAFTMREDLFYEVTAVWPCSYLTSGCQFRTTDGTVQVNVDAGDQVAMRDAMRSGSYLLIDGIEVPVVVDDGIVELTEGDAAAINGGQYASDIYLFNLRASGRPMLYWEVFDYNQGALANSGPADPDFWTDGGRFLWTRERKKWCEIWTGKIEPRIILLTPHLCGRLQHVRYEPLQHTRDSIIGDPYHVDGGVSVARNGASLYADWNLRG